MNDTNTRDTNISADQPKRTGRRTWTRLLLYVVIFVSGGFVGAGVAAMGIRAGVQYVLRHPEEMPEKVAWRLRKSLDLTDVQTKQVEAVLRERQLAIQDIRREAQPKFEAELDLIEHRIADILDGQQRQKWQRVFRRLRRTWMPPLPPERPNDRAAPTSQVKPPVVLDRVG